MKPATNKEIVDILGSHLSKMGWEYATFPELKPLFDLYTRIEKHGIVSDVDNMIEELMELHLTWEDYQEVKEVCEKYKSKVSK